MVGYVGLGVTLSESRIDELHVMHTGTRGAKSGSTLMVSRLRIPCAL